MGRGGFERSGRHMVIPGAGAEPCRPRSARYAEKGYPNYAEHDQGLAPRWRKDGTGGRSDKPEARRGRKRGLGDAAAEEVVVAAGKAPPPILQREEAVAQDQGRKRRMTGAAAGVAAAGKAFPLIADNDEEEVEVSATEGGGDERGAAGVCSENPRLRVMKTLRAFSTNYLHFVQVSLLTLISPLKGKEKSEGVCQAGIGIVIC